MRTCVWSHVFLVCFLPVKLHYKLFGPWIHLLWKVGGKGKNAFLLQFGATPQVWGPHQGGDQMAPVSWLWESKAAGNTGRGASDEGLAVLTQSSRRVATPFWEMQTPREPSASRKITSTHAKKGGIIAQIIRSKPSILNNYMQHQARWYRQCIKKQTFHPPGTYNLIFLIEAKDENTVQSFFSWD